MEGWKNVKYFSIAASTACKSLVAFDYNGNLINLNVLRASPSYRMLQRWQKACQSRRIRRRGGFLSNRECHQNTFAHPASTSPACFTCKGTSFVANRLNQATDMEQIAVPRRKMVTFQTGQTRLTTSPNHSQNAHQGLAVWCSSKAFHEFV